MTLSFQNQLMQTSIANALKSLTMTISPYTNVHLAATAIKARQSSKKKRVTVYKKKMLPFPENHPVPHLYGGSDVKPEMQVVIEKLGSLEGKPIITLNAKQARMQPMHTDAVIGVMRENNVTIPPCCATQWEGIYPLSQARDAKADTASGFKQV